MPRLEPLPHGAREGLEEVMEGATRRLGFIPNSLMTMGRRPELALAFNRLANVVMGPTSTVDAALGNLVSQVASRSAACGYCMAHTANGALSCGLPSEKEEALWDYDTSPLFTPAERAALRVAERAGGVPNEVTDADFDELKKHYSSEQIIDLVAIIAMFGFLNRWNDTMATELESQPTEAGERFLAPRGWSVGKHGRRAVPAEPEKS
jgi:uncharacterized peroxidase-related enzyme